MKKLLSILLIVSTLFMSIGLQACFAENQPESKTNNISQSVKKDKEDETLKYVNYLENQINTLETELKRQGQKQEKSRGLLSSLWSFVCYPIDLILTYCFIYGAAKTYSNWSNDVSPSVRIPVNFIPENSSLRTNSIISYLNTLLNMTPNNVLEKDIILKTIPDLTVPVNVYETICKSNPNFNDCSTAGAPLKNPFEKWAFFTVFDALCSLLRAANGIYNSFKG